MARSHLRHITLRKWFPGNDPIATVVARLCILREDYLLELQGLIKEDFNPFDVSSPVSKPDSLDGNSPSWRRLYFFRNSLRTLEEVRSAIGGLPREIKDLRNRTGGHVLPKGVRDALRGMDSERNALFETGETREGIHYRFAGDITLAIMFPGKSEEALLVALQDLFDKTATLVFIVGSIDKIFDAYSIGRGLHRNT